MRSIVACGTVVFLAAALLSGCIFSSGDEADTPGQPLVVSGPTRVLWYGPASGGGDEIARLSTLGISVTQRTDPDSLVPSLDDSVDVLVIAYTGSGEITRAREAISSWVRAGHGLLIHQPDAAGAVDYAPDSLGATVGDISWCGGRAFGQVKIVDGSHPITAGLNDGDLGGDFDVLSELGSGYTVLAVSRYCFTPALAAGVLGGGRVALEAGNASTGSVVTASAAYLVHLFNWLRAA